MRQDGPASVAACLLLAMSSTCRAAPPPSSIAPAVQPNCGAPGYALEVSYTFGKHARLLPGETPIRSAADMVSLGWHFEAPWYYNSTYYGGNGRVQVA